MTDILCSEGGTVKKRSIVIMLALALLLVVVVSPMAAAAKPVDYWPWQELEAQIQPDYSVRLTIGKSYLMTSDLHYHFYIIGKGQTVWQDTDPWDALYVNTISPVLQPGHYRGVAQIHDADCNSLQTKRVSFAIRY